MKQLGLGIESHMRSSSHKIAYYHFLMIICYLDESPGLALIICYNMLSSMQPQGELQYAVGGYFVDNNFRPCNVAVM